MGMAGRFRETGVGFFYLIGTTKKRKMLRFSNNRRLQMSEKNKDAKNRNANETADAIASEKAGNEKPTVTDEPQHEEHLHMALLGESAPLRDVYLKVSDDTGQFFGDTALEDKMIDFLSQSKALAKGGSIEEIKRIMPQLIAISTSYQRQINFATNVSNGILVKHQIRLGHIFLQQKRLLKKIEPEKIGSNGSRRHTAPETYVRRRITCGWQVRPMLFATRYLVRND